MRTNSKPGRGRSGKEKDPMSDFFKRSAEDSKLSFEKVIEEFYEFAGARGHVKALGYLLQEWSDTKYFNEAEPEDRAKMVFDITNIIIFMTELQEEYERFKRFNLKERIKEN